MGDRVAREGREGRKEGGSKSFTSHRAGQAGVTSIFRWEPISGPSLDVGQKERKSPVQEALPFFPSNFPTPKKCHAGCVDQRTARGGSAEPKRPLSNSPLPATSVEATPLTAQNLGQRKRERERERERKRRPTIFFLRKMGLPSSEEDSRRVLRDAVSGRRCSTCQQTMFILGQGTVWDKMWDSSEPECDIPTYP